MFVTILQYKWMDNLDETIIVRHCLCNIIAWGRRFMAVNQPSLRVQSEDRVCSITSDIQGMIWGEPDLAAVL